MNKYKKREPLHVRLEKSSHVLNKYFPQKVPVIIQKLDKTSNDNIPDISINKFLVPHDMTYTRLLLTIKKYFLFNINPSVAIYLFTEKGNILCNTENMLSVYDKYKDKEDNFLYIYYTGEDTFGF